MRGEFAKFLLAGATNTLLTYLLFLLLLGWMGHMVAYSITYCVGIVLSYFLNSLFVFRERLRISSFLQFPLVYVIQYIVGATLLWLLADKAGIPPAFAMAGVIAATVPITFLVSRFILKKKDKANASH